MLFSFTMANLNIERHYHRSLKHKLNFFSFSCSSEFAGFYKESRNSKSLFFVANLCAILLFLAIVEMPFYLCLLLPNTLWITFVMEICHAFKKSNLHKFGVFIAFVDIVAPMNGAIFGQQVTSKVRIQSQALFLESSECLHSVFCCVPMSSKQPHCSPRLLTRFKLKSYCTVTRKMQLGLVTCQNKQQKGINVSWGLHVLHMF